MSHDETRPPGEVAFERYLSSQSLIFEFEKEYPGKNKRPDYSVKWKGTNLIFDVKDFDEPDDLGSNRVGAFDPYPRIREKIEQGRRKFKEYKEFPCGLVLYNEGHPLVMLHDHHIMLGAMYGDSGFTFPVDTTTGIGDASKLKRTFLGRGKMRRPGSSSPQNTTISALITLGAIQPHYLRLLDMVHEYPELGPGELNEKATETIPNYDAEWSVPRVIVWHNAVARIPFPGDLFRGPYDTHFGVVVEEDGTFQRVTYRGASLPARVKI